MRALVVAVIASAACGRISFDHVAGDGSTGDASIDPGHPIALTTVTAGARHACGLAPDGAAYCWGGNERSQLGIGAGSDPVPYATRVDGTETWTAIAAGGDHTCAITAGQVYCWGENVDGEVTGTPGGSYATPTLVNVPAGLAPAFDTIAAGGHASCAIGSGQLWCWGDSAYSGTGAMAPARVGVLADHVAVSMSDLHACTLSVSQGVSCWGDNGHFQVRGQVGTNTSTPIAVAIPAGGRQPIAISAGGYASCAVMATPGSLSGELWCWGRDTHSVIDDSEADRPATHVGTDNKWSSIGLGDFRACGILDGVRHCWGFSFGGNTGDGTFAKTTLTSAIIALEPADQVVLNSSSTSSGLRSATFGCTRQGTQVACFGGGLSGETGQGFIPSSETPKRVPPPSGTKWTVFAAETSYACGVTDDARVWCWGANYRGQVTGTTGSGGAGGARCVIGGPCDYGTPVPAPASVGVPDQLALSDRLACARTGTTVRCWDENGVVTKGTFATISAGSQGVCGISGGAGTCWGRIPSGYTNTPTTIPGVDNHDLVDVSVAADFACATRSIDKSRVCWGINAANELGDGTTMTTATPIVLGTGTVTLVRLGTYLGGCAITFAGGVVCWGENYERRGGQPTNYMQLPNPVAVSNASGPLTACTDLVVGGDHACAVCGGRLQCWGQNQHSELGRGTYSLPQNVAADVALPTQAPIVKFGTTSGGGLALDQDGQLYCWGDHQSGECADGEAIVPYPMPVLTRGP